MSSRKIQNADVKTLADLTGAGATAAELINDTKIYVTASGINKQLSQAIVDGDIGGGSGSINYIANGRAESDTSGWATYADAAGAAPVDGTGGSPSSTFTRSTSSPLRGSGSFLWTKSAANRQGEGFSYDFTIADEDKGKVLQGVLNYAIASGTFASGDMTIWIYDITNSTLIQPAPSSIQNHLLVSDKIPFEFQTASNSNSYRLIVHTSTTSAVAYTLKLDDIQVGPQAKLYGSPVIDWVSYTPTGAWSTNTSYTGRWRRVGDSAEVQINVALTGAPTAATLTINLPSGMSIDTAKLANGSNAQEAFGVLSLVTSSGTAGYTGIVWYNSATSILLKAVASGGTYSNVNATFPGTFGNGDGINIQFKVPVVGWSSSVVMSSDANTQVIASYGNSQTPTGTLAASDNIIKFGTVTKETGGGSYNTTTGLYTVVTPGWYDCSATIEVLATYNIDTISRVGVYKNSSPQAYGCFTAAAINSLNGCASVRTLVYCLAGDTLSFYSFSNGTSPSYAFGATGSNYAIIKVNGPAQIAASDTVSALYTGSPVTGTLTNAYNITTFGTKVKDTHGGYSSGTYTVQVSGLYDIQAQTRHTATYVAGNLSAIGIFVNGSIRRANLVNAGGAQGSTSPNVVVFGEPLLAGDLITVRSYDAGTSPTFESGAPEDNYFSIIRTGNY